MSTFAFLLALLLGWFIYQATRLWILQDVAIAALKAAELFIAEELEVRQCSFIPLTGPDDSDADYIASAQRALDMVRGAIARSEGVA